MIRILAKVTLLLATIITGACCDGELPRMPDWYLRVSTDHHISPTGLEKRNNRNVVPYKVLEGETTKGDPFTADRFSGFVVAQRYGFWLDLTNTSDESITLLWPEARYVDEFGDEHEVYQQPRGALPDDRDALTTTPPMIVSPGERVRPTIVPLYKQYQVGFGCRGEIAYSEPLIPTNLRELTEQEAHAHIDRMAEEQTPVRFVLPVEIAGERYDYVFTFTLRDWREDLPEASPEQIEELEKLDKELDELERKYGRPNE